MKKRFIIVLALFFMAASTAYAGGNWEQFQDPQSAARGNCPECQPGEAKAETTVAVPHGVYVDINDPPCGDARFNTPGLPAEVKPVLASAFYNQLGPAAKFAIDLGEAGINALIQAGVNDAGTVGQLLRSWTNQPQVANCTRLALVLPKSVTLTRIEKGDDCPGWCGWLSEPVTSEVDANLFAVTGVIKNWSHDTDRRAFLRVFYKRDNPVDAGPAIRDVSLQAYCARRNFTGIRNLDGTGYGWRCTPGDAHIDVNQACAEQHGSNFAAQLLSTPPGGLNDWRCRRR